MACEESNGAKITTTESIIIMGSQALLYFFWCNGKAAHVYVPVGASSEEWGRNQTRFERICSRASAYVGCEMLPTGNIIHGVRYQDWLAGSAGASFRIFQVPGVTTKTVKLVQDELKRTRDVVTLEVEKISKMIDFVWEPLPPAADV